MNGNFFVKLGVMLNLNNVFFILIFVLIYVGK